MEQDDALNSSPSPEEKAMLNRELAGYESTRDAGSPWSEVEARLRRERIKARR
jgi:hypothetical protein